MLKLIRRGLVILFLVVVIGYPVWFALNNPRVQIHYFLSRPPIEAALVWVVLGTIAIVAPLAFLAGFLPTTIGQARLRLRMRKTGTQLARYQEGVQSLVKKDYRRAKKRLAKVQPDGTPTLSGHVALAEVHLAEGNPEKALAVLEKAREAAPGDARALMLEARVYRKMGDPKKALGLLRGIVIEQGPSLGVLEEQRDLLVSMSEWDEAYRIQRTLVELVPDADEEGYRREEETLLWLRYEYGRTLAAAAGRAEDAEEVFRSIQRRKKSFTAAAVGLGDLYLSQGKEEAALRVWEKAYWSSPQPVLLERMEEAALKAQKPELIVKLYQKAMKEWPEDLLLKLRYGKLCLKLDKADEALAQLEEVEKSGVGVHEVTLLKGEAYYKLKRMDQAVEQFRKAQPFLGLGYSCEVCRAPATRWEASCPACKRWGTLKTSDERALAGAKALAPALPASRAA